MHACFFVNQSQGALSDPRTFVPKTWWGSDPAQYLHGACEIRPPLMFNIRAQSFVRQASIRSAQFLTESRNVCLVCENIFIIDCLGGSPCPLSPVPCPLSVHCPCPLSPVPCGRHVPQPSLSDSGPAALSRTQAESYYSETEQRTNPKLNHLNVVLGSSISKLNHPKPTSNLTGLGIQETRWKGTGVYGGGDNDPLDFNYIYSGGDEHHRGVAFAFRRCYKDSIMGWWPEGDRLLRVRLRGRPDNISVVVAGAPTSDTSPENLARTLDVYVDFSHVLSDDPSSEVTVALMDANTEVGQDTAGWEGIIGQHSLPRRSDNGQRLLEACSEHGMAVMGTWFPKKRQHLVTWYSPDGHTEKHIDHIIVNGRL